MCVVYRAVDLATGRERALKVLQEGGGPVALRRFVAEGRLLQQIAHPNVVKVHEVHPDERPPWLVMELLGGRDLAEEITLHGALDPERAARMFADLASGLVAVHALGVRHRDLKPANVRLGVDGVPRLIDFGIAANTGEPHHTKHGIVLGTAAYLPPEIFVDPDPQAIQDTEAADVYALGQTLCEALAGRPRFAVAGDNPTTVLVEVMRAKLDQPFLDPRDVGARIPEDLAAIVRRATARDPEQRTATARQLEDELRAWVADRDASQSPAPVTRAGGPAPTPIARVEIEPTHIPPDRARVALGLAFGALGLVGLCLLLGLAAAATLWFALR